MSEPIAWMHTQLLIAQLLQCFFQVIPHGIVTWYVNGCK